GDRAYVNIDSGDVDVDEATFVFHQSRVRGTAGNLKKRDEHYIYIDDATYTTCEPGNNAWQLKASDVLIDTVRGVATGTKVRIELKALPTLYTPWIRFPAGVIRASGLLFPLLATRNDNGVDYSQPISLPLAPNYDATL